MPRDFGPPRSDPEVGAFRDLLHRSFAAGEPLEVADDWVRRIGRERLRLLREEGRVVAGLGAIPDAQVFGGRDVPCLAVSSVGVDPGSRGRGAGRELVERTLVEARAAGLPLSVLFASTYRLYRSVGYERAGAAFTAEVDLGVLFGAFRPDPRLAVRLLEPGDRDAVHRLHEREAPLHDGRFRRGRFFRERLDVPTRGRHLHAWVVLDGDELVGCARWYQVPPGRTSGGGGSRYDLDVTDLSAAGPEAVRRLLALLGDHAALGGVVRWPSGPDDPFLLALPERRFRLELGDLWLARVLDVQAALSARGYAPGVAGELELEVEDPLLPESAGRWTVRVEGGRADVRRGGAGRLVLGPGALAALFTGHLSARALADAGWARGAPEDLALAGALFAGPAPWFRDRF